MPKPVRLATRIMYLAVICYVAAQALGIAQINGSRVRGDVQFMLFLLTLGLCAIYCLLVSWLSQRSKIALILMSILGLFSAINLAADAAAIFEQFKTNPVLIAIAAGASVLHVVAVVLLFVPTSRNWFWKAAPE